MSYKSQYQPLELLDGGDWRELPGPDAESRR
ncbi:hypothetical protein ASALC70_04450 [Alcanivorax sp. ALC70]|nr:hypothetical protein ASALC70_04450 [Alcanivorax sp. ALC70]